MEIIRIIVSAIGVLWLPGWVWSYVFFGRGKIDSIERFALSCALSIAIVPLVAFYANLVGVKISALNVILEIILIILIGLVVKKLKR